MCAAVEDVHHGNRKLVGLKAAEEAIQRNIQSCRCSLGGCDGNSQNCVGAEVGFVLCAVELDHGLVDCIDVGSIDADQSGRDLLVDVGNRLGNALAAEFGLVAVAELKSLKYTGGCAAGSRASADRAVRKINLSLYGRIAAGVNDFSSDNFFNL